MTINEVWTDIESSCPLAGTEHFMEDCLPAHYLFRLFEDEDCLSCEMGWKEHELVLGFARCKYPTEF